MVIILYFLIRFYFYFIFDFLFSLQFRFSIQSGFARFSSGFVLFENCFFFLVSVKISSIIVWSAYVRGKLRKISTGIKKKNPL